jgi:hypothetical protein
MHQTTVRFGPDLWQALEDECERLGVSVAQFLREAALTRLVYAAGKRGDDEFELALELATGEGEPSDPSRLERVAGAASRSDTTAERAAREGTEAAALAAQGLLARQRARELRERAKRIRDR